MKQRIAVLLLLGMLPWAGSDAQTTPATTTFKVTTSVQAVCEVTATDLAFGAYTAQTATPLQGQTVLRATCTPGSTYNVGLNEGTGGGTIAGGRQMASAGGQKLNYQLYRDAARQQIWGNTPGTDTETGVGTGVAQDRTVFGAVPAAQVVPAGDYTDTVTIRVYY
jgi:spore coat protein U-like protein